MLRPHPEAHRHNRVGINNMEIVVSCGAGMETAVKLELKRLGIDAPAINGRFSFTGDCTTVAKLNLYLSSADRVYIKLAEFNATTFDELFDAIESLNWNRFVARDGSIIVNAKSKGSALFSLSAIQSITKKAIVTSLKKSFPTVPETGARHQIEISVQSDTVSVLLDSSGDGLHKRGYRDLVWEAPIKETLASGILELSVWNPERPFIDPFCGSGTFPIEAAMRAINMPSGYNRHFDFEGFPFIDSSIFTTLKKEAQDNLCLDATPRISGFDINKKAISLAVHHAKNIGVDKYVHFETADMRTISSRYKYGVICTNPPYGERLIKDEKELSTLYRDFGKVFSSLDNWSLYLITAYNQFEKAFGKRAEKTRKLFNSGIECRLYTYLGARPPKNKQEQSETSPNSLDK